MEKPERKYTVTIRREAYRNPENHAEPRYWGMTSYQWVSSVIQFSILVATGIYAFYAWGQWTATKRGIELSARNFERTERPWVGVTAVSFPPDVHRPDEFPDMGPLPFRVTYRNLGRSPALNVTAYTEVTVAETVAQFIANPRFRSRVSPPPTLPVLGPAIDEFSFPYTEAGFHSGWRHAFESGTIELIIFGFIEYADQFRDTQGMRGTLFCYVYKVDEPFPGFRLCPGYNLAW